ncbi:MAG: glutaredoxin [Epulopiscium sp.]|nr:glutaredoxin [Candidatus Epulonipiscium sp.]
MKVIMYGSRICADCRWAEKKLLERQDIELEYRQMTESVKLLKEFLVYRDNEEVFKPAREGEYIGIPFFILEDGTKTLNIKDVINL